MPQMSPLVWMNLNMMFLLSLILMLVVQQFLVIYCKMDLMGKKDQKIENWLWKW